VLGTNRQWKAFYPSERPCLADLLVEGENEKIQQWYEGKYAQSTLIDDAYEAMDFFPHMGPSGTWLYFTAAPIHNREGEIIGAVETLEDVTGRKHTEETLKQINKKLNLMSSVTRHDILNQLTVLAGYLDLLKQRLSDTTELGYVAAGEDAVRNIERQILFTGVYQEIGIQSPEWQTIGTIIRQAVDQSDHGSLKTEVTVEDYEVYADPLLVKVFYNLIDNSRRYGNKNTVIRFYNQHTGDELVIICEDDGVGIPDTEKEHIFERGIGRHSGFGLFLAREILSITGLTIQETGEAGKGARFEIHIPNGKYRQASQAPENNPP
jgi:signal transduction histidine kinase